MRVGLLLVAGLVVTFAAALSAAEPRERLLMDVGWRFRNGDPSEVGKSLDYPEAKHLDKVYRADLAAGDSLAKAQAKAMADTHLGEKLAIVQPNFATNDWRQVDLPHDWAVELPFSEKRDANHGFKDIDSENGTNIGWYRRTFDLPTADRGKSLWIEFDGVYRNSLVWLNGHFLGRHPSGYTSFMYDISKQANFGGKNTLVVRVDASRTEGWFYEGAGIYRHVWLLKTGPVHVAHWGTFVTSKVNGKDATISIETQLKNEETKPAKVALTSEILDASGHATGSASQGDIAIEPGSEKAITQTINLKDAKLWSLGEPNLYRLRSTVTDGAAPMDVYETPFGVRTVEFTTDRGVLLNGKHVEIKGTCNHQDHAGVGAAMPDRLQSFRIEKLMEMGCNAYRTSHNPPTPELLDACDRLGMLVLDETRRAGADQEALGQLESLIRRDRNHPCVFIWSICNEEFRDDIQGNNELGTPIAKAMQDLAHELDASRLCTAAMNGSFGSGFSTVIDVMGFNYPTRGKRPISSDDFHAKFPDKPCLGTEDASTRSTRGMYTEDERGNVSSSALAKGAITDKNLKERGYLAAYDITGTATAEHWWNYYFDRPYMSGSFVWTGFDYRGEPTPYKWPCISSHFGILDTCGFPKDNFYYYQSWWTDKPVVHVFPHWNWAGKEGKTIDVWVHSNADEVELALNGKVIGRQKVEPRKHLEWKVPYAPGTLVARGFRGGKEIAQDKVETTGAPAKLVLAPDRSGLNADGEDISVVNVSVVDDKGRAVPTAGNLVKFAVSGDAKIIGVGNGDPSCHEADKASQRSAFCGLCMAIVQAGRQPGEIKVTASSEALQSATLTLKADSAKLRAAVPASN